MQFHEHETAYSVGWRAIKSDSLLQKRLGKDQLKRMRETRFFYSATWGALGLSMHTHAGRVANNQFVIEQDWLLARRPYYKVYPGIIRHLRKLRLDKVPTDSVRMPLKTPLAFRFAEGDDSFAVDWAGARYRLRTILVGEYEEPAIDLNIALQDEPVVPEGTPTRRTLTLWMDFGEREDGVFANAPVMMFRKLLLDPGINCEQAMDALGRDASMNVGLQIPEEQTEDVVRLVVACCLMADNAEDGLIEPEVLSKDRGKPNVEACVERARRRGHIGWSIGRKQTVSPHWRQGHLMVLKAGVAGRDRERVIWRRGTVVKREEAATMPHGRHDGEGTA